MSTILLVALSRFESPSGICRGAVSTANVIAELPSVERVYLAVGTWQVDYFTQQFELTSPKIQLISIDVTNTSVRRNGWMLGTLPRLAKQLQASFVLLTYPMPVLKVLFPHNCRLGVIIHDLYPFTNPENFGYPNVWANQAFMRLCVANVDQLVFVSTQTQWEFSRFFPHTSLPMRVVHWYAALNPVQQLRPSNVLESQRFLLLVAQHRKNKNISLLLKAFARLRSIDRMAHDTHLYVVGSRGPETPALEEQIRKHNLGAMVHFVHALTDPELAYLYAHCEVVIAPSSAEGFGYTLIESVLFGKPVVCSDIPIFREVGGDNCVFFNLNSLDPVQALADAIDHTLTVSITPYSSSCEAPRHHMKTAYAALLEDTRVRAKR